jgi:hypothetical protein
MGLTAHNFELFLSTFSATTPNIHTCFISDCKLGFISDDQDSLNIKELSQVNVLCDSQNITIQIVLGLNLLVNYQIYFSH